ncbi:hypothetical protein [Sphingobacterium tabacisoli]|uniref:Uncharacterized protein n=1 Tax=Sphingobacterium tabacisoli TaxID=2044855 RepID=A0ABW5L8L6_9SPHI|nr:hypothetical protein [Sphingobacterium tabacisoli]
MAHQRAQISKHSQQIQGVSILDSSNRGWFFRSDTAFYYHPDSGLYARNGILSFWEAGVKSKQWLSRQDSVYQHNAESVDTHFFSTHLQKLSQQKWIPIMGILLLLVCGYGICYIGKRFI